MSDTLANPAAERIRSFFLYILFFSIPFSIAGGDFAIIGLYVVTMYLMITKKEKWISTNIQYCVIILIIGAFLAALASNDPLSGIKYFRALWRFGLPFLVFLALKNRQIDSYLRVLLVVSICFAIYACFQSFTGIDVFRSADLQKAYHPYGKLWNSVGAFSHHLTFGGVTLILFTLFAPGAFDNRLKWYDRALFALGALCNLLGLIFSLGRSVWIGAIVATFVMVLANLHKKSFFIIIVAIAIGFGGYSHIDPKVKEQFYQKNTIGRRIESITSKKANIDRLLMWQAAINMIKDNPVFGLGPGNGESKQVYYDKISKEKSHKFQHQAEVGVHNIYLQTWVDFGFMGIIAYLFWWMVLLFEVFNTIKMRPRGTAGTDALLTGLFGGFAGIMVAGIFENNFRDGEVQTTIFTAMGIALALINQKKEILSLPPDKRSQ